MVADAPGAPGDGPYARRQSRCPDRTDGAGGGHVPRRPFLERAPLHRRRLDHRLPHRGLPRRGQHLEHHPPQHEREDDDVLRREPPARDHAALPDRGGQPRGVRSVLEHGACDHRRYPTHGAATSPGRGGRHFTDHPLLAGAFGRRGARVSPATASRSRPTGPGAGRTW